MGGSVCGGSFFLGFPMDSTGESDRKRRHFSSISPMPATAKKQPVLPIYEDRKVRSSVLVFASSCSYVSS